MGNGWFGRAVMPLMCVLCMRLCERFRGDWLVLMSLVLLQRSMLDTWTTKAAKGSKLGMWISSAFRHQGHRFKRRLKKQRLPRFGAKFCS